MERVDPIIGALARWREPEWLFKLFFVPSIPGRSPAPFSQSRSLDAAADV